MASEVKRQEPAQSWSRAAIPTPIPIDVGALQAALCARVRGEVRFDDGCCGMAGAFGFERGDHYDVSLKCGERALLPAVRAAPTDALILSDGFSCREQIAQTTSRRALHLAEALDMALHGDAVATGASGRAPEQSYAERAALPPLAPSSGRTLALAGACAAIGVAAWAVARATRRLTGANVK